MTANRPYIPGECTALNVPAEFVPAVVTYLGANRARVTHPLGDDAENAVLARERLARKGFRVILATPRTNHP